MAKPPTKPLIKCSWCGYEFDALDKDNRIMYHTYGSEVCPGSKRSKLIDGAIPGVRRS